MPTMTELITKRDFLEAQLEDASTYTDELELVWENTEIELAKKIDAYGFVIDDLKMKNEYLAEKKRKLTTIKQQIERDIERIKSRLYEHSQGKMMEGNEYKLHPLMSESTTVDLTKVDNTLLTYHLPKLKYDDYEMLIRKLDDTVIGWTISEGTTTSCNVTDLPPNHPALIKNFKPSVRIT